MATIRKQTEKWQAQVRRKGFPAKVKSFERKSDALEWARKIEAQIDCNELHADRHLLEETTLADLIERYLKEVSPNKKSHEIENVIWTRSLKLTPLLRSVILTLNVLNLIMLSQGKVLAFWQAEV